MLILDGANDKIQVITSTTGTIEVHASWVDNNAGTITPSRTNTAAISTATTTDVVAAPGASKQRNVKNLSIMNDHASSSMGIDVQHTDGTNVETLWGGTLLAQESLVFDAAGRWTQYDANGLVKASAYPVATQADMESASSLVTFVTPGRQQFHPGHPKFVCMTTGGATPAMQTPPSYNMTSITDAGQGRLTVTIATDFSSASYCVDCAAEYKSTTLTDIGNITHPHIRNATLAAGSVEIDYHDQTTTTAALQDPTSTHTVGWGDQA